jgi:hypothetical protein
MNQIDDLGHCGLLSAFSSRRMRELNALPIAQQSARQKQVVDICRRSLEIVRLHIGREGPLSRAMGFVGALIWCLQTRGRSRACRTVPTSHKTHQMMCHSPAASLPHSTCSDVHRKLVSRRQHGLAEANRRLATADRKLHCLSRRVPEELS